MRLKTKRIYGIAIGCVIVIGVFWVMWRYGVFSSSRPNIILVSIDTVRADHLGGAYGYGRNTSPAMTALAGQGILYRHAISQAPWTLPSVASMLTALYPSEHNAVHARKKLSDKIDTLAEILQQHGYHTIGIVSHIFTSRQYGMGQGFDIFDESQMLGHDAVTSDALTRLAINYLNNRVENKPFFLWVHYFDPHFTYVRHPVYGFADDYDGTLPNQLTDGLLKDTLKENQLADKDVEYVKAVYDEEIAYTDYWIKVLVDELKKKGLDRSTIVFVTADHGEYFMERGRFFHSKDVYEELVHVPLIITGAVNQNLRGRVVEDTVEISSIPKTVTTLAGIDPSPFAGADLLSVARDGTDPGFTFTEGSFAFSMNFRKKAVLFKKWKLIYNFDDGSYELYHQDNDPEEKLNRWSESTPDISAIKVLMKESLDKFPQKKSADAEAIELKKEDLEKLRSLGYVE